MNVGYSQEKKKWDGRTKREEEKSRDLYARRVSLQVCKPDRIADMFSGAEGSHGTGVWLRAVGSTLVHSRRSARGPVACLPSASPPLSNSRCKPSPPPGPQASRTAEGYRMEFPKIIKLVSARLLMSRRCE